MKKSTLILILLIGIFIQIGKKSSAQLSDYIFGFYGLSGFHFGKLHIPTGEWTTLHPSAITGMGSTSSSSIGLVPPRYYYCTGSSLLTFDPETGNILSNVPLPIASTASFYYTQYNPCDNNIYGILMNSPLRQLARFNPADSTMTVISNLVLPNMMITGIFAMLDPAAGIYYIHINNFMGIDIYTGAIVYDVPSPLYHEAMEHSTHRIIGTIPSNNHKVLASFDPPTGVTTTLSATPWAMGYWKPLFGGSCIDQNSGIYYYSGAGAGVIGVETQNGTVVCYIDVNLQGEFYQIQHFSEGSCLPTDILQNDITETSFISPNPATNELIVQSSASGNERELIIFNAIGEKIFHSQISNLTSQTSIDISQLPSGIYFVRVRGEVQERMGKFVKQ
jgi:hypothetical protein